MAKLLIALCLLVPLAAVLTAAQEGVTNYLDVEAPPFLQYNSPLRQPDSLRSRPYFDFLSTLYRRDATKADLFRPYLRSRRAVDAVDPVDVDVAATKSAEGPVVVPLDVSLAPEPVALAAAAGAEQPSEDRPRRAIVFRPLFVYKQQVVRREELKKRRRRL